jgi:hypothetical protein
MKRLILPAVLTLLAAACGGAQVPSISTTLPVVTVSDPATSTTPPPGTTATTVALPAAPDFSLMLADGSIFTLSEEKRPVYLLFWAEW